MNIRHGNESLVSSVLDELAQVSMCRLFRRSKVGFCHGPRRLWTTGWWWRDTQILRKRLEVLFPAVKSPLYLTETWRWHVGILSQKRRKKKKKVGFIDIGKALAGILSTLVEKASTVECKLRGRGVGASTVKWTTPNPCIVLCESDSSLCTNIEFYEENIIDILRTFSSTKSSNLWWKNLQEKSTDFERRCKWCASMWYWTSDCLKFV